MRKLRNKMKKQEGFTLIEMLIVVAIIAILIAVSIPLVQNSLERARQATDAANERAAKAEATITYLTNDGTKANKQPYVYDAVSGKLVEGNDAPETLYGKCQKNNHNGRYIKVTIDYESGDIEISWAGGGSNHGLAVTNEVK